MNLESKNYHGCPLWLSALETYFGGDADYQSKVVALQRFFGYCLLPTADAKRALVLYGEPSTGKSVVERILGEVVGRENQCSISVSELADPRRRASLLGRRVNMMRGFDGAPHKAFADLIRGLPLLIDPKYVSPFRHAPACKHVITASRLPARRVKDPASSMKRWECGLQPYDHLFLVIEFKHVIPRSAQDYGLAERILAELPSILLWALDGARDLILFGGVFPSLNRLAD
ncbi:MAG: hypothetical protein QM757_26830 [Paludibaculum sp.]